MANILCPNRVCPECGEAFKAHHGRQQFCQPAHQTAFHDRSAKRGKALMPLLQVWRKGRHGAPNGAYALAQVCALLDAYNAEDAAAGRQPAILVAEKAAAGWAAQDLIAAKGPKAVAA